MPRPVNPLSNPSPSHDSLSTSRPDSPPTNPLTRSQFIYRYGVLGWGLSTAALWCIGMGFVMGFEVLPFLVVPAFVVFPLGGYAWGAVMWSIRQDRNLTDEPVA